MQSQPQPPLQLEHHQQQQFSNNKTRQSSSAVNSVATSSDSQLNQIMSRLNATTNSEERKNVFANLKKTPHLFAAFLKINKNEVNFIFFFNSD